MFFVIILYVVDYDVMFVYVFMMAYPPDLVLKLMV